MRTEHTYWSEWAESLRHKGLNGFAAWALEAGGPLMLLGAQVLYFGQPFIPGASTRALARLLENRDETEAFVAMLREDVTE
jgi:hypothetical protein